MSRVIKFRQPLHDLNGYFFKMHYWGFMGDSFIGPVTGHHADKNHDQFTGLLDKNLVEIYEGDIVEHKNGWTGVIVFNQEDCAFISENVRDRKDTAWLAPDIQAVIGNIHENPELLKP